MKNKTKNSKSIEYAPYPKKIYVDTLALAEREFIVFESEEDLKEFIEALEDGTNSYDFMEYELVGPKTIRREIKITIE